MKTTKNRIGYKPSNNGVCLNDFSEINHNFKFEVGQTYNHEVSFYDGPSNIKGCFKDGFRFYKKIDKGCIYYYEPSPTFVLFEVEILSNNVKTLNGQSVTDSIRVIREIPLSEHKLFEVENNVYSYICGQGFRVWETYDTNGKCIHFKTDSGYEEHFN
jgi:hypothetical protein